MISGARKHSSPETLEGLADFIPLLWVEHEHPCCLEAIGMHCLVGPAYYGMFMAVENSQVLPDLLIERLNKSNEPDSAEQTPSCFGQKDQQTSSVPALKEGRTGLRMSCLTKCREARNKAKIVLHARVKRLTCAFGSCIFSFQAFLGRRN